MREMMLNDCIDKIKYQMLFGSEAYTSTKAYDTVL